MSGGQKSEGANRFQFSLLRSERISGLIWEVGGVWFEFLLAIAIGSQ